MKSSLSPITRRRLDIQGLETVSDEQLAPVARWLRLAYGLCATLAAVGTALASPAFLLALVPIAALAAVFPVHPFDHIYNHGIRHLTGTGPLPKRGAPARFACGMGAVWLTVTAGMFATGHTIGWVRTWWFNDLCGLAGEYDRHLPSVDDVPKDLRLV